MERFGIKFVKYVCVFIVIRIHIEGLLEWIKRLLDEVDKQNYSAQALLLKELGAKTKGAFPLSIDFV